MPRKGPGNQPTAKSEQARVMWGTYGHTEAESLATWDPKSDQLVAALLEVVASGATLVLRPGSGQRSIGVAIWEGDTRHAPKWCYDAEELDEWAGWVVAQVRGKEANAAD